MAMVVLKQSSISLRRKTQGVNGWTTKAQRTQTVNDVQTKIKLTERKDNALSETR